MIEPTIGTRSRTRTTLKPYNLLTFLIIAIIVLACGLSIVSFINNNIFASLVALGGLICFIGLLFLHRGGWKYSAHAATFAAVVLTVLGNPTSLSQHQISFTIFLPSILATIFLPWYWTIVAFVVCILGIGIPIQFAGPLFQPDALILSLSIIIGIAVAGEFGRRAQYTAEQRANLLELEKQYAEDQSTQLAQTNLQLEIQVGEQKHLLELIASLETPAVQVAEGVLLVPLIGGIDSRRALQLTHKLLEEIRASNTRYIILDVAGVSFIDTGVIQSIVRLTRTVHLLGCSTIMSGISADMALTLTNLGVSIQKLPSVRNPQEALLLIHSLQDELE